MQNSTKILSIAGFDPSGGAGILADIKTFTTLGLDACGVITSNTIQTHAIFKKIDWISDNIIVEQLSLLLQTYPINHFKIGLIKNILQLETIINCIHQYTQTPFIVWDPVLFTSTNFEFHANWKIPLSIVKHIAVITPNAIEFERLWPEGIENLRHKIQCAIYLKGGHKIDKKGTDTLYLPNETIEIPGEPFEVSKHGSGCVFASALTAYHLLGHELIDAATKAKKYTESYILSDTNPYPQNHQPNT